MIKKILDHHKKGNSAWLATASSVLGFSIVLIALQLYTDIKTILLDSDAIINREFLIINKKISDFDTFGMGNAGFTHTEITKLNQQPYIKDVAQFSRGDFEVYLESLSRGGTVIFFEAVPDQFLDVSGDNWSWNPGQKEIPIILPSSFVDAYNFGVAPATGQPPLSYDLLKIAAPVITLSGNGLHDQYTGKIIALSDRLNSFMVPQNFLDFANMRYGSKKNLPPLRLMLATSNNKDVNLKIFLSDNNYDTNDELLNGLDRTTLLQGIFSIFIFIGIVILLTSSLSFFLYGEILILRSKQDLSTLILLGYKPQQVFNVILKMYAKRYITIFVLALILLSLAQYCIRMAIFSSFKLSTPFISFSTFIFGITLLIIFILYCSRKTKKQLKIIH